MDIFFTFSVFKNTFDSKDVTFEKELLNSFDFLNWRHYV